VNASEEAVMIIDYALSGAVAVLLTAYLIFALVRPERF
jgi:K+-transporting ATPase KdpF subunit